MDTSSARPIHVALNAHLLSGASSYRSAGVHHYIYHLIAHLPMAGCRVTAFVGPQDSPSFDDVRVVPSRWPTHRPAARAAWEQVVQPWALRQARPDLAHGPVFVGPLTSRYPFVVTVHDLSFLRFPHMFRPANRLYLHVAARASARRARRVIAVSAHTAEETVQLLGVARERVDVVYHGVAPSFCPLPPEAVAAFRARQGLPERFILYVGTLEPRKNLPRLVEAFASLRQPGLKLVLAGGRGWYDGEVFARIETLGVQADVLLPGYVPNAELPLWYNATTLFAFPSLYEGFGMPIVEAQACGAPVLTSTCSALPEAAGDAALLIDPQDSESIAEGLRRLLTDQTLRETLRQRGLAHTARLTWRRTAVETAAVYRRALAEERDK